MKMELIRDDNFDVVIQAQERLQCKVLRQSFRCFDCQFDDCVYDEVEQKKVV